MIEDMRPRSGAYSYLRDGLAKFIGTLPTQALLVEVGSWKGEAACMFAARARQVVCVDSWRHGLAKECPYGWDDVIAEFMRNTQCLDNVAYWRRDSVDAASWFPLDSIDVVYIDASHIYKNVKQDIHAWFPKVKRGGIIAGHDYDIDGVKEAVIEAFGRPDMQFVDNTWAVRKA